MARGKNTNVSARSAFSRYAKRVGNGLRRRLGLPLPAAPPSAFVRFALPGGREYDLSLETENPDTYHAVVRADDVRDRTWSFTLNWIRPADVFFDLGANIGVFAVPASVKGAQVHAFELLPGNASHLARAVERNGLQNFHIVIGPVSDRATFLSTRGGSAWAEAMTDGTMMFPTIVIDDYVREKSIGRVNIMKIDIEGSEMAALLGTSATIERDHPDIVVECNALTCGNHGHSYRDILRMLVAHSYRIYRIGDGYLAPWRPDVVQETILADYLATVLPEDEIEARSGQPIRDMSEAEVLDSFIAQDRINDHHKQYSLLIAERLPQRLREHEAVQRLTVQWKLVANEHVLSVLRRGSA